MTIARELEAAHSRRPPGFRGRGPVQPLGPKSPNPALRAGLITRPPAGLRRSRPALAAPSAAAFPATTRLAAPHGSSPDLSRLHNRWAPHLLRVPQAWPRPPRLPAAAPTRPGFSVAGAATTGSLARPAVVTYRLSRCRPFCPFTFFRFQRFQVSTLVEKIEEKRTRYLPR